MVESECCWQDCVINDYVVRNYLILDQSVTHRATFRPVNYGSWSSHTEIVVCWFMMTSSNGNIFRVTGHLCGEFTGLRWIPAQRPVTRSFDVFFDLRLNKWLSKQSWGWWFETSSCPLWRPCNVRGSIFQITHILFGTCYSWIQEPMWILGCMNNIF